MRKISVGMMGALAAALLAGTARGVNYASANYGRFRDAAAKRLQSAATRDTQLYPSSRNGGQHRKSTIRARRMNNAGHGNRWSKRHA